MAGVLIVIFATGDWGYQGEPVTNPVNNARMLGRSLMITYPLAFWVASFILTITIIGSLLLARKD